MASALDIGKINSRRLQTPGRPDWEKSVRPDAPASRRYYVATADAHANEPLDAYQQGGMDPKYVPRIPHMRIDDDGRQWLVIEGWKPQLVKGRVTDEEYARNWDSEDLASVGQAWSDRMEPDDLDRMRVATGTNCDKPGLERMHADMDRDGVDAAVVFPNRGLLSFATFDPNFSHAMCSSCNTWTWSVYGEHVERFKPMALIQTSDLDLAAQEIERCAKLGFPGFNIPAIPWVKEGAPYNQPKYDRLWALFQEVGRPVCMHVATGKDPRGASGNGGAILNFVIGAGTQVVEPMATFLASGVFERFPRLTVGTIEGGVGWVPWLLESMDDIYYKHHMWVRPYLKRPPSSYYKSNCFSTFQEDHAGLHMMKQAGMLDNVVWGSDYPHMEGSWPHSSEALERQLGELTEGERQKVLGLNATRIFGFDPNKRRIGR
jgi:predicted TIM-barrel fold metal-dependent hydrolase